MFSSLDLLDVSANAASVALVAVAFLILARATGVFLLELTPVGLGLTLAFFAVRSNDVALSSDVIVLVTTSLGTGLLLGPLLYFYAVCRKAAGGESSLLVVSFAVLNALFVFLGFSTEGRSIPIDLVSPTAGGFDRAALEVVVLTVDSASLVLLSIFTRGRAMAALQLARDDDRLLGSFGLSASAVRFAGVLLATVTISVGIASFVALQESFAVALFESFLIPSFAIALTQTRVAPIGTFAVALVFVGVEQMLTASTGELLKRSNQGLLFSVLVAIASLTNLRNYRAKFDQLQDRTIVPSGAHAAHT